jgi:hypothetical protein
MNDTTFVVCLENDGFEASVEVGKLYQTISDHEAEKLGGIRVFDEDGEDNLFDIEMFCPIQVPPIVSHKLTSISKQG